MTADNKWNKRIAERDRNRKWLEENIFDLEYAGLSGIAEEDDPALLDYSRVRDSQCLHTCDKIV